MKLTKSQLNQIIKEEIAKFLKESHDPALDDARAASDELTGRDKIYDEEESRARRAGASKPMSPEEHAAQLALYNPDADPSIEPGEPVDITAGMSDDEVENLANELAAAAQAMGAESYEWYPDDDDW